MAETRADRTMRGDRPGMSGGEAAPWAAVLRAAFPRWGILHDPFAGVWVAVRGRTRIEVAPTPAALYERLKSGDFRHAVRHNADHGR